MSLPKYEGDLYGTLINSFRIGAAGANTLLKYISGGFAVRNTADSADQAITVSSVNASSDTGIVINSDAAGSGSDWSITVVRPSSGMTANWTLTLPTTPGTSGQVLQTNGSGVTSWVTPASGATNMVLTDDTALAFGSSSTVAMFTKPALAKLGEIRVYVDTVFNATGPATVSIGISGTTSKYGSSGQVDLTTVGLYTWDPGIDVVAGSEAIIATFSAGSAGSTGAARIEVDYVTPT